MGAGEPDNRSGVERRGPLTRRQALAVSLAGGAAAVIAACGGGEDPDPTVGAEPGAQLDPTPACGDDVPTPEQTEGPFFTPDSPERTSLLEPGIAGSVLLLRGRVLDTACRPIAGASGENE